MAKAAITNVTINDTTYTATYSTGTIRTASLDKMPQTVKAWLEANKETETKTEIVTEKDEAQAVRHHGSGEWVVECLDGDDVTKVLVHFETEQEAIDHSQWVGCPPVYRLEPPVPVKAELVEVRPEPVKQESPGAAEAVAFGICMAMAVTWWGVIGLVRVLAAMIGTAAAILLPKVKAGAVKIGRSAAAMIAAPTVKAAKVKAAVIPALVGMLAMMIV